MPYALDIEFGFVVIGKKPPVIIDFKGKLVVNHTILQEVNVSKLILNFWSSEPPPEPSKLTEDDIKCEKCFY